MFLSISSIYPNLFSFTAGCDVPLTGPGECQIGGIQYSTASEQSGDGSVSEGQHIARRNVTGMSDQVLSNRIRIICIVSESGTFSQLGLSFKDSSFAQIRALKNAV